MNIPNANQVMPQDLVTKHSLLIQGSSRHIWAPPPDNPNSCGYTSNVIVFCTKEIFLVYPYKAGDPSPDHRKMLKSLLLIEEYYQLCKRVMGYTPIVNQVRTFTGSDGIKRTFCIEINDALCYSYGGASYNGENWVALTKTYFNTTINTINNVVPVISQAFCYEIGRCVYDLSLDHILDWQTTDGNSYYGYWTLGYNGAMTVLGPEHLNIELDYAGHNVAKFRQDRLSDLSTYVNNTQYTFENTWSKYLLPWSQGQSVNDLMSGLLIYLADQYGGIKFLERLFARLKMRPPTSNKNDRIQRANNFYQSVYQALLDLYDSDVAITARNYFYLNLRWTFVLNMS